MRNKHFFKIYAKVNKGESILRGMDAWCRFWINTSEILNGLFTCSRDSRDGYHSCERTKCFVNDDVLFREKKKINNGRTTWTVQRNEKTIFKGSVREKLKGV